MPITRNPQDRIKAWTGTVHFSDPSGYTTCKARNTSYSRFTTEDVTCKRCIAICGSDESTGHNPPEHVYADEYQERRANERAARRAARG